MMIQKPIYLPEISRQSNASSPAPDMRSTIENRQIITPIPTRYTGNSYQASLDDYDYKKLSEQVFEWQWMITTRLKWTYTQHDYEVAGITLTGDPEVDFNAMEDWTNTTRTIAELVELHAEGKEFIIRNQNDVERIFNIIQDYTTYIGLVLDSKFGLGRRSNDETIQEVLEDAIKMQNLANRIFPVMVNLNYDKEEKLGGLFDWIDNYANGGLTSKLDFNPYAKYGFNHQDVYDRRNIDNETGLFKAVDLESSFSPGVFDKIRRYGK